MVVVLLLFFFFFSSFCALVQHISLSPFGLPRVAVFACQLFFVLWWLVVILVDGCGYTLCFFSFSFLPTGGCGCHNGVVTCGGGVYGGLWLLQWCLWQVEPW